MGLNVINMSQDSPHMSISNGPRAKAIYFNENGKQSMSLISSPLAAPNLALKTFTSNGEPPEAISEESHSI